MTEAIGILDVSWVLNSSPHYISWGCQDAARTASLLMFYSWAGKAGTARPDALPMQIHQTGILDVLTAGSPRYMDSYTVGGWHPSEQVFEETWAEVLEYHCSHSAR